jgi:hypothetical protein
VQIAYPHVNCKYTIYENINPARGDPLLVKLVYPTDFEILAAMSDGKRQTATNLGALIDRDSRYMNNRLASLAAFGLVEKVGPSPRSSMYVITSRGRIVLDNQEAYNHESVREFALMIEAQLDEQEG